MTVVAAILSVILAYLAIVLLHDEQKSTKHVGKICVVLSRNEATQYFESPTNCDVSDLIEKLEREGIVIPAGYAIQFVANWSTDRVPPEHRIMATDEVSE